MFKREKKKKLYCLSWKRVLSNIIYALKLLFQSNPWIVVVNIISDIIRAVTSFLNLYFARYMLAAMERGEAFGHIAIIVIIYNAATILYSIIMGRVNIKLGPYLNRRQTLFFQKRIYKKITEYDLECYENPEFYNTYMLAAKDARGRSEKILSYVTGLISHIITITTNGILITTMDPLLLLFVPVPIILLFLGSIKNKIQYAYERENNELNRRKGYPLRVFYESTYAKEIRLSKISKVMIREFNRALKDSIRFFKKRVKKLVAIKWITETGQKIISDYGVMLYAIYRVIVSKTMMLADCLVVAQSVTNVSNTVAAILSTPVNFANEARYIENLRHFMEYEPKIKENETGPVAKPGFIEMRNITFGYFGSNLEMLKKVNIHLKNGEKIALVGRNGAGKTTLIKLLLRLYDPSHGMICLNGKDIKTYNLTSYHDLFATVFQDYKHFSMSIMENVLMRRTREGDHELVIKSLQKSGVYDRVMQFPNGIDTTVHREFDDKGVVFSGGESQKLSIAHVYSTNASVVILDEPSSALDPIAEHKMYKTMLDVCHDRSIIFVSHRLSSATMADRIYMIDHGEIVESGTHAELMMLDGYYAEMFKKQSENYIGDD